MTRYLDEPLAGGEATEEIEGYRAGVDAVMSYLDTESSFQIRCLIEEGQI